MKGFRFKELVEASSSFFLAETNNSERIFNTVNHLQIPYNLLIRCLWYE